jgi:hypothetical protein
MRESSNLKRKSYFVNEAAVHRARRALGAATDSEAVRLSVESIAEMEEFWRFIKRSKRTLPPDSLGMP